MKSLLCALLFSTILMQTVEADDKKIAQEFLESKLEAVLSVLRDKDLSEGTKNKEILDIVTPIFDFPLMAKLTLGKKHWKGLQKDKKKEFTRLFVKNLKESYRDKLTLYTDEKVIYKPPVRIKKKIHIPTELISRDNAIPMLYKLRKSKRGWKVYDIEIKGISLISSYRSQYGKILSAGTIDDLLQKMNKPTTKPEKGAATKQ